MTISLSRRPKWYGPEVNVHTRYVFWNRTPLTLLTLQISFLKRLHKNWLWLLMEIGYEWNWVWIGYDWVLHQSVLASRVPCMTPCLIQNAKYLKLVWRLVLNWRGRGKVKKRLRNTGLGVCLKYSYWPQSYVKVT